MGLELQELLKFVKLFDLDGFYVQREEGDTYRILFGNDDPLADLRRVQMENSLLKAQIEKAMDLYYEAIGVREEDDHAQAVCTRRAD